MSGILNETVESHDLKKFENIYHDQLHQGNVTSKAKFEYAWCLVRSKYSADIQKGVMFLEELYDMHENGQRDYLYYLAIGNAKLKEYTKSLNYLDCFLKVEPGNMQVISLRQAVKTKMEKEGFQGIAAAGGAILIFGAILGVGMAIVSKVKS